MSANHTFVVDEAILEYPIGFPVNQQDLVVYINGREFSNYEFKQSTNSIVVPHGSIQEDDIIIFRIMKDLV